MVIHLSTDISSLGRAPGDCWTFETSQTESRSQQHIHLILKQIATLVCLSPCGVTGGVYNTSEVAPLFHFHTL